LVVFSGYPAVLTNEG